MILAAHRMAEARRIVADQHELIEKLKASKQPVFGAERSLQIYLSSLKLLEVQERSIKEERRTKKSAIKKHGKLRP